MKTTSKEITTEEYKQYFLGDKKEKALNFALDIRKFEIDLYWKRASYFWTFIGATMAGYLAIQASSSKSKEELSIILSCLGLVFSFAWFCVNKGSKYWQENWEKHVDMLEDDVTGPLYKIVLSRNKNMTKKEKYIDYITGPSNISVSKINQLISLYVSVLWAILIFNSLPKFALDKSINWLYITIICSSIGICLSFLKFAKSYEGSYYHTAILKRSRINPKVNKKQKGI